MINNELELPKLLAVRDMQKIRASIYGKCVDGFLDVTAFTAIYILT